MPLGPLEKAAVEEFAAQLPPSEITEIFQPLIETVKPIIGTISLVLGGLFGLYLIFILFRLYYERKKVKYLKNINYDLDYLNQHFNLPYSQEKKPYKLRKVLPLAQFKELEKSFEEKKKKKK